MCRIEADELSKKNLSAEKLNLEMKLNNIQVENKNSVKKEQFLHLTRECDAMTLLTKTDLNNAAHKLKECLNDLEIINIQTIGDQG